MAQISRNLGSRIVSALVMIPLTVAATGAGGVWFMLFCLAAAGLGMREWLRFFDRLSAEGRIIAAAVGVVYMAATVISLLWLREAVAGGALLILFLFVCVWAADTGAYFTGRMIGGPRLAPNISPSKTWAGLAGGLAGAVLAGYGFALGIGAFAPLMALPLALLLALASVAGDLFESAVKRHFAVKDSGRLIPGHGGVLDRIDGLLFAAPALALFQWAVGNSSGWWTDRIWF